MNKAYLSEIYPWWTVERQMEALASVVPGWPKSVTLFTDRLDDRQRRAHQAVELVERALMLKPTSRRSSATIYVASPAVLAWSVDDMRDVLRQIEAKGWSLVPADGFPPTLDGWRAARQQSRLEGAAKRGGAISAKVRGERAQAGAEKIKDRWGWPSDARMAARWGLPHLETISTADLLAEAGISRGAANHYLKQTREQAQAQFLRRIKARIARAVKETT